MSLPDWFDRTKAEMAFEDHISKINNELAFICFSLFPVTFVSKNHPPITTGILTFPNGQIRIAESIGDAVRIVRLHGYDDGVWAENETELPDELMENIWVDFE